MKSLKAIAIVFIFLLGCSEEDTIRVKVNIKNATGNAMSDIVVDIRGQERPFMNLEDSATSGTIVFTDDYVANSIGFSISGERFEIVPDRVQSLWVAPEDGKLYTYIIYPNSETEVSDDNRQYLFDIM
ncbi:MAG: hypothetical protein AAFN93_03705 [Bacteroidota bacterium]